MTKSADTELNFHFFQASFYVVVLCEKYLDLYEF